MPRDYHHLAGPAPGHCGAPRLTGGPVQQRSGDAPPKQTVHTRILCAFSLAFPGAPVQHPWPLPYAWLQPPDTLFRGGGISREFFFHPPPTDTLFDFPTCGHRMSRALLHSTQKTPAPAPSFRGGGGGPTQIHRPRGTGRGIDSGCLSSGRSPIAIGGQPTAVGG